MGASLRLESDVLRAEPGEEASLELRVRNTGAEADEIELVVVGDAAPWCTIEPQSLRLEPGAEGRATLRVVPPRRGTQPPGPVPLSLRARPFADAEGAAAREATLLVGVFRECSAELVPRTGHGRLSARHELHVENLGNAASRIGLDASDPERALGFELRPPLLEVAPGEVGIAKLRVRPRERHVRGPAQSHRFVVTLREEGAVPAHVSGTFLHEAILPRWLAAVVVTAALFALAWFALLRPEVESISREQARDAARALRAGPPGPAGPAGSRGPPGPAGPSGAPALSAGAPGAKAVDGRLAPSCPKLCSARFVAPKGLTLYVTDIILGNPAGDAGTLLIARGKATLVAERLENFRDLDYHLITPMAFPSGTALVLRLACSQPGPGNKACTPSAYWSGFLLR
jgi:hypothetical protein